MKTVVISIAVLTTLALPTPAVAQKETATETETVTATEMDDSPAYWEYGLGFGAVRFEDYPSAKNARTLALPVPTFQYRGKILRADDRDGAHAYLFKSPNWHLEVAGTGYPLSESAKEDMRRGMDDIPFAFAVGPQLVRKLDDRNDLNFGVFGALAMTLERSRPIGQVARVEWVYKRDDHLGVLSNHESVQSYLTLSLSAKWASADFAALYYQVDSSQATAFRPAYDAKPGLFSTGASIFQSFKSGRGTAYVGASFADYSQSANKDAALHQSDNAWSALVGCTYILGESSRPEVPEDETTGVIQRLREKREERKRK